MSWDWEFIGTPKMRTAKTEIRLAVTAAKDREIQQLRDLLDSCGKEGKKVLADNHELRELNAELLRALELADKAMNHMGDILNGMDAVTEEDIELATPAFEAVAAAIAKAKQ